MSLARRALVVPAALLALLVAPAPAVAGSGADDVRRGLEGLVAAEGGPPGAIATLTRDGRTSVVRAGVADVRSRRRMVSTDHMRIASVAKAFSGAVALHLVRDRRLALDDTIGQRLPALPAAWRRVTLAQLLNHTSGLPDYTRSRGFFEQVQRDPRGYVSPQTVIDWVRASPLVFPPGSRYAYSNTDNIVVGLMAEAVTGRAYDALLREVVFGPARLRTSSLPRTVSVPSPFIHGYAGEPRGDVTTSLNPSGAWASGGIVSTPRDLNRFIRALLGLRFFGAAERRAQFAFVPGGESSPPGPGANDAGLAIFRYRTRCGTVYGHTGNFPGYVQFAAANADGTRAVTTSLNIPAPEGALLRRLRAVQETAVCAVLR